MRWHRGKKTVVLVKPPGKDGKAKYCLVAVVQFLFLGDDQGVPKTKIC